LEDDPKTTERILSSILMTPTDVQCVPTLTAALSSLDGNLFDIIVIDRHLGGWVSAQSCKDLVARAGGRPVVGLIDEDCVLDLQDGIEAGLTAVYYKDEMSFRLMRRLARLAFLPSGETPLADAATPPLRSARS
jgi:DNA-binding response OmpR family regulator